MWNGAHYRPGVRRSRPRCVQWHHGRGHIVRTEREKMLAGELYFGMDPLLVEERQRAQQLVEELQRLGNTRRAEQLALWQRLLGSIGAGTELNVPFLCDYGSNIRIGRNGFVNYDCVFLDCNLITIGDNAQIGPGVHIYTALHPLGPETRRSGLEAARPVTIGNNVWLGGRSVILPGVTIGDDSVIGAGAIVTRDVPPGVVVVGNPARVVKRV